MVMLPQSSINDAGSATAGTPYGGPFTGPDTFQENGLTFLDVDRDITLGDAVAFLQGSASAPVQNHAYLLAVGNVQNVVLVMYSNQLNPANNQRVVPKIKISKGQVLYIRGVQLTEASTAAAEATTLVLKWNPA